MRDRQEQIRDQRAEIDRDIKYHEAKLAYHRHELKELEEQCAHPQLGHGHDWQGMPVKPNECPDCGFIKDKEGG